MSFVSYAQNFEDVLLNRVFGGQEAGFYVDVGAYHPVEGSVTKAFYDRGWSGINIEPGDVFNELAAQRSRDVNLRMAALDHAGEVAFLEDQLDHGMSRVSGEIDASDARMVPCDTLEGIYRTYGRKRPVDFLKVDAEGAEAAIVRSTNWRVFRPRVLVIEATLPWSDTLANGEWEPLLIEQGYVRVYFDGINCYYITEEETPVLARHFVTPVNVLDRAMRYDQTILAQKHIELRDRCQKIQQDLGVAQDNLSTERDILLLERSEFATYRDKVTQRTQQLVSDENTLIAERDALFSERNEFATQRDQLTQKSEQLAASQSALIAERDALVSERNALASERDRLPDLAAAQGALIGEREALAIERDRLADERKQLLLSQSALVIERDALLTERARLIDGHLQLVSSQNVLLTERDAIASERDRLADSSQQLVFSQSALIAERDALAFERDRLADERQQLLLAQNALIIERDGLFSERNNVTAERNILADGRQQLLSSQGDLIAERDSLAAERNRLVRERHRVSDTQNGLIAERNALLDALGSMEARLEVLSAPAPMQSAPQHPATTAHQPTLRHRILRTIVFAAYWVIRPIVRPIAWRLRGFLTGGMHEELRGLMARQESIGREARALHGTISPELRDHLLRLHNQTVSQFRDTSYAGEEELHQLRDHLVQLHGQAVAELRGRAGAEELHQLRDQVVSEMRGASQAAAEGLHRLRDHLTRLQSQTVAELRGTSHAGAEELHRLAVEMERILLTLAMEPAERPLVDQGTSGPGSARAPLQLPGGRSVEIEYAPGDLSVGGALAATGGQWEPHVRRYLEAHVQSNWTCMDIGANIGAHTLSLATLVPDGRVIAFEADPSNHALLARNVEALTPPKARIELIERALWDTRGTLLICGAKELAGCSFVTTQEASAAGIEQKLRTVVNPNSLEQTELHPRMAEVSALPLDEWMSENQQPRLDLIKLDVEGAEVNVIRGAAKTIRRHRPTLIIEYNPACAVTYFGQPADALFHELEAHFNAIHLLEEDGSLSRLAGWNALRLRLDQGKGWEDLVCLHEPSRKRRRS